jgi:hypothetical protein
MNIEPSPRVIGAVVVGFALVAGAYVVSNFGQPTGVYDVSQDMRNQQQAAPIRTAIPVSDKNNNGIEDWRDEFVTTDPIVLTDSTLEGAYQAPNTLTGQTGITFVQDMIRARNTAGIFGGSDEEVIEQTIDTLELETSVAIYDTPDIIILRDWDEESIRTYANALALAIIENDETDLDFELYILQDILNRRDYSRLEELRTLAELYRLTRDAVIEIPVPELLVKEHLDIINTLHAVHNDVLAMSLSFEDPAVTLLRLKRYEDDLFGMIYALQNLYQALIPYASSFNPEDPALYFTQFNPDLNRTNRIRI